MLKIEIIDKDGKIKEGKNEYEENPKLLSAEDSDRVYLTTQELNYSPGDAIRVTTDWAGRYLMARLDETLDTTLLYIKGTVWQYDIPTSGEALSSMPDGAFIGKAHYISVRYAKDYEIIAYRNLALNPHDQKHDSGAYPHAYANVETRNDSTFFAKNAIDGIYASNSHGSYPYQSWGINRDPKAELTIDFGRPVRLDSAGIVLRADFPHDSHWEQVTLRFSDGSTRVFDMEKTGRLQHFAFDPVVTEYAVFEKLLKAGDESPFPALTELELYGVEN